MCATPARHRVSRREPGSEREFWTVGDLVPLAGRRAKHARPLPPKYALPIGRVGALAVSLGIGFAVAHSSGVAYADSDSDSSVSASRDSDRSTSGPRRSGTDRVSPERTGSVADRDDQLDDSADLDDADLDEADLDDPDLGADLDDPDVGAEPEPSDAVPGGDQPVVDTPSTGDVSPQGEAQRRHTRHASNSEPAPESHNEAATVETTPSANESDAGAVADGETPQPESITVDLTDAGNDVTAASSTVTESATTNGATVPVASASTADESVETVGVMTTLVSSLVTPFADPTAPARAPWFDAFLAWVRRQITHTFFNRSPVWGPVESHQLLTGQVEFDLNARDPNGDPLTYKIVQPSHGLVTRNPLTGTFIYTPTTVVTGQPLQDTFRVTISDSSEHLTGLCGVIQSIFHTLSRIIGLAEPDEVTLSVSVTVNPIVEVPPIVVVTPVAVGTVGTPVRVSPVVVITDLDSPSLASATVEVTVGDAGDVLNWGGAPEGVSATYVDGVLTFTGAASAQAYQELLQSVTLTSTSPGLKTVSFAVVDDQGNANTVPAATVVTMVGLPVELPPLVLVAPVVTGRTNEPITVTPIVVITDIDSDILASATVRITDPADGDVLGWGALPSGMTVTTGDGWVTFTGDASAQAYQHVLQSVTLTSTAPGLKAVSFSVVDDDGNVSTVPAITAVTVLGLPIDVPPLIVVTPVATGSAGAPIVVSPIVVITDLDSTRLLAATVTVNDAADDDVLSHATLPSGISASYADGVLTFTGEATLADYQQLLRTVTLTASGAGLKSVSFTVTDAQGNPSAVPATTVVTILGLPTEVPPLVVVMPVATGSTGAPIVVSPIVVITDLDSTRLRSATVTVKDAAVGDVLSHGALPAGVSASYVGGVLTFTGEATVADYRTLLQSVTFTSPSVGLKAISFTVTDLEGNSSVVPAGTVVTVVGLASTVAPLVVVSPVAAGVAGTAIRISPVVVIADLDSDEIRSATVAIQDADAGDVLGYAALPGNVVASYLDGVLTFTGDASVADYQSLLASVTLTSPTAGLKAITFTVTDVDGNINTVPAGTVVTVVGVPVAAIAPVIVVAPVAAGVIGTPVRVSPIVVITDLDSEQLGSVRVTLTDAGSGDVLGFDGTLPPGVTAGYTGGVLTFTGTATVAAYRALLESVTLTSAGAGVKAISFSVTDAHGNTSVVPAGTLVTMVGLSTEVPPLVVVSPVAAGRAGSPIRISPVVIITDLDSTQLGSATVQIADPGAGDTLGFDAALLGGLSAGYAGGVLTITGDASIATYRALLESVTLTSDTAGVKAISFAVTDVQGNTSTVPAGTLVTIVGLTIEAPPLVVVSPVAAGRTGSAITVSPIVVIADGDSDQLSSATVTLADAGGTDVLGFVGDLPDGVLASYSAGVLRFDGTASLADYRQLLASVTLTSDTAGVKVISFAVTDLEGNASTVPAGTVVTVVGVPGGSIAPVVVVSPVAVGSVGSPVAVSPVLVIVDVDSSQLSSATITLDDAGSGDQFAFGPLPDDVTAHYADGVLTFSGTASVQEYQALLRSVTLTSAEAGLKTVSFSVTDIEGVTSVVPAGTLVTLVGLSTEVPPLVLVSPVAAGVTGSSIVVSPVVVITDPDSTQLASARVTLNDPNAGDLLGFTATLPTGVQAGYADGVLTFTGVASITDYQALLRSVTLTAPGAGVKTVSFSVTDVDGITSVVPAGTVVTVVGLPGVSIAPVVVVSPVAAGVIGSPVRVSPIVVITDLDSSHLGSATVTLADAGVGDVLAVDAALPSGVQGSYAGGVLTLTGSATVEQYRALLASVTLTSDSAGLKAVSFSVTDLDGVSNVVSAGTLVTMVGLSADVPPLVLVSPVAAGVAGSAIVVSPIVVLTDPDSTQMGSATVTVADAGVGDVLDFTAALPTGVQVSYGAGSLTFTGDATAAAYQALLQSVTFTSTAAGVTTVTFTVTDAEGATSVLPATTVVTVVGLPGVSIPPVVVVSPVAAGTVGSPTTVSPIVVITDLDSSHLGSATVTLADAGVGDVLAVDAALPSGVQGSYAGGVLTLTGSATVEQYRALLASVTLTSDSAGLKAVSFSVTDLDGVSNVVSAGTLVTMVGLSADVPPLVLVSPIAIGLAGSAIVVSPIVVLTDPDSTQMSSATVTISNPNLGDVLAVTGALPAGVQASYTGGVLTLTGSASVADYQALLERVTLTATSGAVKTVSFALTDAEGITSIVPAVTVVTVVGLLDLSVDPVVVVSPVAAGTVGQAITVSPVVVITDLDSSFLRSATVRIDDADSGDILSYSAALPSGVQADYADGVLSFTGIASLAQYEALLASVTLTSQTAGVKSVSYTVTDTLFNENAIAARTAVTVLGLPVSDIPPVVVVSLVAAGAVGRAIRVSPLTVIADLDSSHIGSAAVALDDPADGDTLGVDAVLPEGVQASYADGVLTLTGAATVAQYQTLLQSVVLTSVTAGLKTVTFSVTDLEGVTSVVPAVTLVTVVGVPETSLAPVVVAAPVAAGTTGSVISVSPILVIADVDSSHLGSAVVTVAGYQDGDVLDFDATLAPGVLGSYTNGLLTFSGTASVADYQALLRSVTLTSTSIGIRTVSFEVTDAGGATNLTPAGTVVTVVGVPGVSLPPLVVASPVAAGTAGSAITVSPVVVITDVDSSHLGSATVTVDGYQDGDVLGFDGTLPPGVTAGYVGGVLTFTGDATVAEYQALLRSVTLTSESAGVKAVSFAVIDADGVDSVVPAVTVVTVIGLPATSLAPVVVVSPIAAGVAGTPITVSPVVVISDLDSSHLGSATVTVDGYQDGDVLGFDGTLPPGVTAGYVGGVLTFTGDATVAEYQALLRSVTLTSTQPGLKSVTFVVTDIEGGTNAVPAGTVVTVLGVPGATLAPVVVVSPVAAGRTGSAIVVSPVVVITDLDSSHIASAAVTVGGSADGVLLDFDAALAAGILGSYADGVLTFTGAATVAEYQALLRSVTLTSAGAGVETVTFAVTDLEGNTNVVPAGTVVTVIGLPELTYPPVVVVSPIAAGVAGTAITVSPVVVISDLDSSHIGSATVTVDGYQDGDVLDVTAGLSPGVQAGYADGVLTVTGDATVAEYQALLRSVTLTSAGAGVKTVTFAVTDLEGNTNVAPAGTVVTVVGLPGVSVAPVVVVAPVAAGATGSAIVVSPIVVITDLDSDQLGSASVRVANGDVADVLNFDGTLPDGVDVDYAAGELTFTGAASTAVYQQLLAAVTLTSQTPGLKAVTFTVTDLEGQTSTIMAATVVTVVGLPEVSIAPVVVVSPVAAGVAGSAITVSPVVVITDLDSDQLQSATVTVAGAGAGDVLDLSAALPDGFDADYAGGVLTISGTGTIAEYQALLASVTLTATGAGVKTVGFAVTDAQGITSSVIAGTLVTVIGLPEVSIPPVLVVSPAAAGVAGSAITVSPIVLITDLDSSHIRSATVTLVGHQAGDVLGLTGVLPSGVSAVYLDGVLTITGDATVAEYQALLASVTLTATGAGVKTVSFAVTDTDDNVGQIPAATIVTVVGAPIQVTPLVIVAPAAAGTVGSAITVSPIVVVTDLDSPEISSATVTVEGYTPGDVLGFTAELPDDVQAEFVDGVLTFTGTASIADYQRLLESVTFTAAGPSLKTISFTVTDTDDNASILPAGTVVTVAALPVTIAPLVVVMPTAIGTVSDPVVVSPVVVITDLDSSHIAAATVTIAGWSSGDVLDFAAGLLPPTVVGQFDGGVLTFTGNATVAEYQALLASVTLTSEAPGLKAISFAVTDTQDNANVVPAGTVVTVVGVQTAVAPLVLVAPVANGTVGTAIRVSPIVAIGDLDSEQLGSATVSIGNYVPGDSLSYTATLPEGVLADYADGVLTFTGPASLAEYRTLLESVMLTSTVAGLKSVSFTVTDLEGNTSTVPAGTVVTVLGLPTEIPPLVLVTPLTTGTVGQPITVSPIVLISDLDSSQIRSATITIGNPAAGDVLGYTATLPDGVAAEVVDGVLIFTGGASLSAYQQLLASVTLTSAAPGLKTILFTVTDVDDNDNAVTAATVVTVLGLPALADPVVLTSLVSVSYTAGGSGVAVDPNLLVLDPDSSVMTGATVAVANPADGDTLTFGPLPSGVTGNYNNGVLTFEGDASAADYQALLRSVQFSTTSSALASIRTITFTITDDDQRVSAPAVVAVTVLSLPTLANPVVVTSVVNVNYTAGGAAVPVDPNLLLFDVDSAQISGAVVRIIGGAAAGEILGFTEQAGIMGSYDSQTGILTFTGTAAKSAYQDILRSVTYTSASGALATIKSISFVVTDVENNNSAPGLVAVTVLSGPVSIPPLVITSVVNLNYTAGNSAVTVDSGLVLLDLDSSMLGGAVVRIAGGFAAGDTLSFTPGSGITGSYDAAQGILTLSGDASLAAYQQVLRSVQLSTGSSALASIKTVSFVVTDIEGANSLPGTVAVTVLAAPTSIPPLVITGLFSSSYTAGNSPEPITSISIIDLDSLHMSGATAQITGNFTAGDVLTFTAVGNITGSYNADTGLLTLTGSGTALQYSQVLQSVSLSTPFDAESALRTVTFTVTDAQGATSAPVSAYITVRANTAPTVWAVFTPTLSGIFLGMPLISATATINDDSDYLSEMVVTLTAGPSGDSLLFQNVGPVTGTYNPTTRTLTFTGQGTVSQYQAALRQVAIDKAPLTGLLNRTVTIEVWDQYGLVSNLVEITNNFVLI